MVTEELPELNEKCQRHLFSCYFNCIQEYRKNCPEELRERCKAENGHCQWRKSNYKGPHEYIFVGCDPELAAEIDASPVIEKFQGVKYHYLYKDGYKYWRIGVILNRRKVTEEEWAASQK